MFEQNIQYFINQFTLFYSISMRQNHFCCLINIFIFYQNLFDALLERPRLEVLFDFREFQQHFFYHRFLETSNVVGVFLA